MFLSVIKSVFINAMSSGARTRVKANPRADVYRRGQRARRVYISQFRTDMFRIANAAVGNGFNQITFFPFPSSSPLHSIADLKNPLFVLQDSKQLLPSVTERMSLPALG